MLARRHLELAVAEKGERQGLVQMRKHLAWYLKGLPGRPASPIMETTEVRR